VDARSKAWTGAVCNMFLVYYHNSIIWWLQIMNLVMLRALLFSIDSHFWKSTHLTQYPFLDPFSCLRTGDEINRKDLILLTLGLRENFRPKLRKTLILYISVYTIPCRQGTIFLLRERSFTSVWFVYSCWKWSFRSSEISHRALLSVQYNSCQFL
jgi:hypothetical protein